MTNPKENEMATKTKAKAVKAKTPKTGTCLMTGQPTAGGNFRPGMDARLKGALIKVVRGETALSTIPKAAIARMRENGTGGLVGFRLNGDKLVKIGNFSIAENGAAKKGAKAKKELNSKGAFKGSKAARKDSAARKLAKHKAATAVVEEEEEEEEQEQDEDEE